MWVCRNKKTEYGKRTLIMGIINITPDSFSDGGKYFDWQLAANHALTLAQQGADILDFGAQSTRPEYTEISAEEETERLERVIKTVRLQTELPISVDTYYPAVAQKAIEWGADIINDISGVVSKKMANIARESGCGWIITHHGAGTPADVKKFFDDCLQRCAQLDVPKQQICFDMGIGFGKTQQEDLELIRHINEYKPKDIPLLMGCSRKRVIGQYSRQSEPSERIYGNIAADTAAIFGGVDIIRLHDVKNERQGILMADALKR